MKQMWPENPKNTLCSLHIIIFIYHYYISTLFLKMSFPMSAILSWGRRWLNRHKEQWHYQFQQNPFLGQLSITSSKKASSDLFLIQSKLLTNHLKTLFCLWRSYCLVKIPYGVNIFPFSGRQLTKKVSYIKYQMLRHTVSKFVQFWLKKIIYPIIDIYFL